MKSEMKSLFSRAAMTLVLLTAPVIMMWGQEMNKKFSMTTHMFIDELQELKEQQASGTHRAPARRLPDGSELPQPRRLIASPDTIGGVAYISCFIHLSDPSDLSAVRDLGVRVQSTFDGLDFITASVPVDQLNALADVDNVTKIEVSRLMRPTTDVARQKTNVDDLLTQSANAAALGVNSKYDGTGVVLGIVDTGIDFQHIAFKDKNGKSRIKRAYVYNGSGSGVEYTTPEAIAALTTDDATGDHGTHVASTAGGSSVIVNKIADDNFTITVTDDHANATYGGMAPGADLYLAGVKDLSYTELMNAISNIVAYADSEGKPVVVSNSWGSQWGPHDGTGTLASFVSLYFGDSHPNHIILFASSNDAGNGVAESGGYFVKKGDASQASPLGTIIRTKNKSGNGYSGLIASAWASSKLNCELYVLDNSTGKVLMSRKFTTTETITNISVTENETTTTYYTGNLNVGFGTDGVYLLSDSNDGLKTTQNGAYSLALRVYPANAEATANINMWAGDDSYFSNILTTADITWTNGTDDMCVSDQATIPDVISVGAYVSRSSWTNYQGTKHHYTTQNPEGDIATFSSYATAEISPTGQAYPWITAPGAAVIAGVNHFHTGGNSYFGNDKATQLVVNNTTNPYGKMQGTSMATPVAAGIVALWLQAASEQSKTLTVNQVKEVMRTSAIKDEFTTTGANASHFGNGKIDALAGISAVSSISGGLLLADNADNSTTISNHNGPANTVTLSGRTLYMDGYWNTLCLPFSLTAEQVTAQLAPTALKELDVTGTYDTNKQTGFDAQTGTLNLYFKVATAIEAGKPYLIKWAKDDGYDQESEDTRDIKSPVFSGVTIDANASTEVSFTGGKFKGTYSPVNFTASDQSILFLGVKNNKNTLYYPQSGAGIKAFRAYFQLSDGQQASAFNLNFDDDDATGIITTNYTNFTNSDEWYTLSGTRLIAKPTKPGLYINNGKKVVIK